jgi:hypothetical protein
MAIICRKYNLLFIMTPRTACTAVGELLCHQYGGEFLPSEDILDSHGMILVDRKHCTLSDLIKYKVLDAGEAESLLKVAAVRNPFDSLVSLYIKQRYKYKPLLVDQSSWVNRLPRYAGAMRYAQTHSFSEWAWKATYKKALKRSLGFQPSMFREYTKDVDVTMRFESIEENFTEVLKSLRISSSANIPVSNRTEERTSRDYRSYYSAAAKHIVTWAYAYDLKKYGYRF